MIFWRRKEDPSLPPVLDAIMEWLPPLLDSYGLRDTKYKKTRDSVEALGKPPAKPHIGEVAARLLQLTTVTLSSKGWKVEGITPTVTASDIAVQATGNAPLIDFSARGLAPAVVEALQRSGVDTTRLPEWARDFQLNISDLYRAVDMGGGRIQATSPHGNRYEVSMEVMWVFGRLGVAIRFKKK